MSRHLNLYFTAMSAGEARLLVFDGIKSALLGNPGFGRGAASLEAVWTRRFGGEDALAFPSARTGLYALLRALDIGEGDEVIITGFTCTAVPVPVLQCGAVPIYADIDPRTYSMDPSLVERLIGPRTRAIVVQHTFGISAALPELTALARNRGIYLIEDACLALGSMLDGKPLGSFGDAAIYSFELSKTISAGWGGMVQANVPWLGESLRSVRGEWRAASRLVAARRSLQAGLSHFLYHPATPRIGDYFLAGLFKLGIFRYSTSLEEKEGRLPQEAFAIPADVTWKVLLRQVQRLDLILERSRETQKRYMEVLSKHDWPGVEALGEDESARLVRFPILVQDREEMTRHFSQNGIELGRWFVAPIAPRPPAMAAFHYDPGMCPVAERVSRHIVNLPLHSRLSGEDVDRICSTLDNYLRDHPQEKVVVGDPDPAMTLS
jgi:dTDP-4-amino-4,6-dideoxygalactose transaminase